MNEKLTPISNLKVSSLSDKFLSIFIVCLAIASEGKIISSLIHGVENPSLLWAYLILHCLASLIMVPYAMFKKKSMEFDRGVALLVFCLTFSLSLFGILTILIAILPSMQNAVVVSVKKFNVIASISPLEFSALQPIYYGPGGFRSLLLSKRASPEGRLKALMKMKNESTPHSNRLMRELLKDPSDELRLLAYGTLEKREMEIQKSIQLATQGLANTKDSETRYYFLRRLAFLNWEVAYQELAEGDLSEFFITQALTNAEEALQYSAEDGALWGLKGRIFSIQGLWEEARVAFESANQLGAPTQQTIPRLAELAFQKKDFNETVRLLSSSPELHQVPALDHILRFWLKEKV